MKSLHIATALRSGLKNYTPETLRHDLLAGLVVSLVALPLAMALSIAVGLPPRHGLFTAVVAGLAAAVLGGSPTQVSGPTAAFVVIVAPIVQEHGIDGLAWCEIMAGAILVAMGALRLGKFITLVPHSVVTGFTAGIAVTIAALALNDFFGLGIDHPEGSFVEKLAAMLRHLPGLRPADALTGGFSLLVMVLFPRLTKKIPAAAAGIAAGTALAWLLARQGIAPDTLATRFSWTAADGTAMAGIQPLPPAFALPQMLSYGEFRALFVPALTVAVLAALESLLSATVADRIAGTKHDPHAELNGIGAANILSGLVAGIPATGAIARTAANIHAGAKTPVASATHALLILLYMLTLSGLINMIPMAALAALLLLTAWRMSHVRDFTHILKTGSSDDRIVLTACFLLTAMIDMVAGVSVGMILAGLLFMRKKRRKIR